MVTYGTPASGLATGTTLAFNIDAGSGANRCLYVGLRIPSNRTITSITYGGQAMTLVGTAGAINSLRAFRLIDPPTGTNSFSVTTSGSGSDTLRGVGVVANTMNTADPDDTPVTQEVSDTNADQSVDVPTETGDSVLSFATVFHSSAGGTITSLNTSLIDIDDAVCSMGLSHGEDAAEVTTGWSFTGDGGAGADFWQLSLNLNQAADEPMAAVAEIVASASAALNTQINLAAEATSVASSTGVLMTAIRLAAAAVSNAAATGALTTSIQLAAEASGVVTATANFAGAVLQAAATDVATAIAALDTAIRLGATGQSVATSTAELTNWATVTLSGVLYTGPGGVLDPNFWTSSVPGLGTTLFYDPAHIEIYPNGEISSDSNECTALVQFFDGVTWQLGLVVLTSGMVAYARDVASASAQLTSAIELAAAASALATATAAFSTAASLAAQASDVATATGSLTTAIPFSALATSIAAATAELTNQIRLQADAVNTATATANLNGVITLDAAAQAISSMTGNLQTVIRLSAAAAAQASGAGEISTGVRLGAAAQGVASAAGALSTSITMNGAASSAASASGDLTTARLLFAAALDVATAIATLNTGIPLGANALAISAATAELSGGIDLLAAATAEATATAELTDVITSPPIGAYETDPRYVITRPRWSFLPLLIFTPRFNRKDPDESVVLTFDLASALTANETLQGPITITVRTLAGSDASPSSLQKDVPSYDLARKRILLPVGGGLEGRWYYLKVKAKTSNSKKTVTLAGLLPVME